MNVQAITILLLVMLTTWLTILTFQVIDNRNFAKKQKNEELMNHSYIPKLLVRRILPKIEVELINNRRGRFSGKRYLIYRSSTIKFLGEKEVFKKLEKLADGDSHSETFTRTEACDIWNTLSSLESIKDDNVEIIDKMRKVDADFFQYLMRRVFDECDRENTDPE